MMHLTAVKTLILNTIHKEYRHKSFVAMLCLTLFMLAICYYVFGLLKSDFAPLLKFFPIPLSSFALLIITLWSVLLSLTLSGTTIQTDISNNILTHLFSCPISRYHYIFSRTIGIITVILGYTLIASLGVSFVFPDTFPYALLLALISKMVFLLFPLILLAFTLSLIVTAPWNLILMLLFYSLLSVVVNWNISDLTEHMGAWSVIKTIIYFFFPHIGFIQQYLIPEELMSRTELTTGRVIFEIFHYLATQAALLVFLKRKLPPSTQDNA